VLVFFFLERRRGTGSSSRIVVVWVMRVRFAIEFVPCPVAIILTLQVRATLRHHRCANRSLYGFH